MTITITSKHFFWLCFALLLIGSFLFTIGQINVISIAFSFDFWQGVLVLGYSFIVTTALLFFLGWIWVKLHP